MTTRTLVTADELLRMPDDGRRYELIEGELIEMAPAGLRHGEIAATVAVLIGHHVRQNDLGSVFVAEPGFFLQRDPDTVRAPGRSLHCQESSISRRCSRLVSQTRFPTSSSRSFRPVTGQDRYSRRSSSGSGTA